MKSIQLYVIGAVALLIGFGGVAFAADAVGASDSSLDIAKAVYNAFAGHHYAYAGALGLILGVALTKRYIGPKVPWLHTDTGGSLLVLLGAFGTALAASLANGGPATWDLLKSAAQVGMGAAGGYAMIKNLIIKPLLKPLAAKAPAWMQPLFSMIFWVFDHKAGESVVADATTAGKMAVAAKPSTGVVGVIGKSKKAK